MFQWPDSDVKELDESLTRVDGVVGIRQSRIGIDR